MNHILRIVAVAAAAGALVYSLVRRKAAHRLGLPANDISTAGHSRTTSPGFTVEELTSGDTSSAAAQRV